MSNIYSSRYILIQLIVVAEEVLASKVLHFVTIFGRCGKSAWHDVTLFQKVVPKSSAGYPYGVVWAEFHKIKIETGNDNIVTMIAGGVRGHSPVCRTWTLTNHYYREIFKRGVNDSTTRDAQSWRLTRLTFRLTRKPRGQPPAIYSVCPIRKRLGDNHRSEVKCSLLKAP